MPVRIRKGGERLALTFKGIGKKTKWPPGALQKSVGAYRGREECGEGKRTTQEKKKGGKIQGYYGGGGAKVEKGGARS